MGDVDDNNKWGVSCKRGCEPSASLQNVFCGVGYVVVLSLLVHFDHHSVLSGMASDIAADTFRGGYFIALAISIAWSTLVGVLGYEEMRPWGSFFLQYLWEFCLGMWIAERFVETKNDRLWEISNYRWGWLLIGAIGGMALTGLMAWSGGLLKLYNDIPSLIGYLSVMLIIYKLGENMVNRFFIWASGFGYELYLVHSLVFAVMAYLLKESISIPSLLLIKLVVAYLVAYGYKLLMKLKLI